MQLFETLEELLEWGGTKKSVVFLVLSGLSLIISFTGLLPIPFDTAWIAVLLCGLPIVLEAFIHLVTERNIKAGLLVAIALIASVAIGELFAAGEVAFIMQLGELLEHLTVSRARAGIEKLVRLTPRTARLVSGSEERIIPAEQVKVGDVLRVLPGETVPVDGVIVAGQTSIDQSVMTGESLPVDKSVGDEVSSGTVNRFGSFGMEASKVGEDSSLQRMIHLVRSADAGKAKIVGLADRWATVIVVIAIAAAILTGFVTGELIRAVTILVVFCPCALVLATPTAIMAAIGNATRHGFLVREGDALERLATVEKITFDKTGTLTFGTPEVVAVHSFNPALSDDELFACAAGAELRSEHPLGKAVVRGYQTVSGKKPPEPETFLILPGQGVSATVDGRNILAGNRELLTNHGVTLDPRFTEPAQRHLSEGCTVIWLAADGAPAGFIALSDTLRPNAADMIGNILQAGVTPVLLTGDNENAAQHIAGQLGITEVKAACLPEDKLNYIDTAQKENASVCMIGDGINDAPALKKADVSIAMGGIGSDIAIEAADIALVNDDISRLPHLLRLSRRMMRTIKCNMVFSILLNFAAIALAFVGALNPVLGALVHNAGSIFVITCSALLLKWERN